MNLYSKEQIQEFEQQHFAFLQIVYKDNVLHITLDRPEKKNALHPQMINELGYAFQYAHLKSKVRAIVIRANGNVFCAGGDLKAMAGMIEPNNSSIPTPNEKVLIGELFNKVFKPIICVVEGPVFAGGFLFMSGSHYTVALDNLDFGLPEVKRGLFPMQVMASMLQVMPKRKVLDWCMRGYTLAASEAKDLGLLTHVVTKDTLKDVVNNILEDLKSGSPTAIRFGLEAADTILSQKSNHQYLYDMLQQVIQSKDGQEGLLAFREKRQPNWD